MEYNREEMYDKLKLTDEQIKACKEVFKAMRKAGKLGVEFWDMYGELTAYNGNVFSRISMENIENGVQVINSEGEELIYSEPLKNFHCGCSDDDVWLELK